MHVKTLIFLAIVSTASSPVRCDELLVDAPIQVFPDSINRRGGIGWPDPVLRPGSTYRHRMEHRFTY